MFKMRIILTILLSSLLIVSCGELQSQDPISENTIVPPKPDLADAFVGRYSYVDDYFVVWGNDSRALKGEGFFTLSKLSKDQVKMTGAWTSIGKIVGNTISFSEDMQSDNSGYITYKFGVGTLSGKVLSFRFSGTGSLKYSNGVAYPWDCSGQVVATIVE